MSKWIEVESSQVRDWVKDFVDRGDYRHLSTISGYEEGDRFYLVYHFLDQEGELNVRTSLPKEEAVIDSITPVIPGAVLYEREIQDLLGVKFRDIPDSRRLILPEDWPEGVYPLRKDFKPEEMKKWAKS